MRKDTERLWAYYKYEVMMHSQKHYNIIRDSLKIDIDQSKVQYLIDEALKVEPTKGSILNTFDHLWGYFKKVCTIEEKEKFKIFKEDFQKGIHSKADLLNFIKEMSDKYDSPYLSQSSIINRPLGHYN